MATTTTQRFVQPVVGLLNFLGALLGVAGLLLLVVWTTHAFGARPVLTLPLFGPQLQFAVTDDAYVTSWVAVTGEASNWVIPETGFEPLGGLLAVLGAYFVLWRDKVLARWRGPQQESSLDMEAARSKVSFEAAQIGEVRIDTVVGGDVVYQLPARSFHEQRNRRAMLTKVRTIWVDGFLHEILNGELRIELELTDRPDEVFPLVNALYQERNREPQRLPAGTSISEVFDRSGGELLILGAPGAGKTTMLLELLDALLQRAECDETHPLPIVFPLSTWAAERKPLREWLVEQLNTIYDVPKKIGQRWVDENGLLPLLDGLDDVAVEHQEACTEAINTYRREIGGLVPIAVASRIDDYKPLSEKLRFIGAVLVESLTERQVESYLEKVGEPLRAVRELLERDPEVMKLLDTPLMLNVVTLAFSDTSVETLRAEGTVEERRERLWGTYVERMFTRKEKDTRYSRQQTRKWLSWLATQMEARNLTVFYLERLQPDWLTPKRQWRPSFNAVFPLAILLAPISRTLGTAILGPLFGTISELLFFAIVILSGYRRSIRPVERIGWVWSRIPGLQTRHILIVSVGLAVVAVITIITVAFYLATGSSLVVGVIAGLSLGIYNFVRFSLIREVVEPLSKPNQAIKRSLFNGLVYGFAFGPLSGLMLGFDLGIGVVLLLSLNGFVAVSLYYGVRAFLQHYALRLELHWEDCLPLKTVSFLDYCTERLLLQRVGGGWTYKHRSLMEHFASKYEKPTK